MATLQNSIIGGQFTGCCNSGLQFGCCSMASAGIYAFNNVSFGVCTLRNITTGDYNVAVGYKALNALTSGNGNTAVGYLAGCSVTTGNCNAFLGYKTYPASGAAACSRNTAIGVCTQRSLIGNNNTAIGFCAQTTVGTTTGTGNVAIGCKGGLETHNDFNVTIGNCTAGYGRATVVGSNRPNANGTAVAIGYGNGYGGASCSIALGYKSSAQANYSVAVGYNVNVVSAYHMQWGNSSNNVKNCIWPNWTTLSDQRDKANIQSLDSKYGIEFIKKLK